MPALIAITAYCFILLLSGSYKLRSTVTYTFHPTHPSQHKTIFLNVNVLLF